ncbi:MAG: response regulator [Planctomycetota bacterium]
MRTRTQLNGRSRTGDRDARTPRILCIDDDPDISRTIALRLRAYDVEVHESYRGVLGIWIALRERPDLIITDLGMPMGDGELVLDLLKRKPQTAHIPVIVLSGQRGEDLPERAHRLGAVRFLHKPVLFTELAEELARHIPLRPRPEEHDDYGEGASNAYEEDCEAGCGTRELSETD